MCLAEFHDFKASVYVCNGGVLSENGKLTEIPCPACSKIRYKAYMFGKPLPKRGGKRNFDIF